MRFHIFEPRLEPHVRKSLDYLDEARLAWVEHQAAAEHHAALAKMYADRIGRIELEVRHSHQPRPGSGRSPTDNARDDEPGVERAKIESVVAYPSRLSR